MRKKAVLVVFLLLVILLAVPVLADGGFFSKMFGWLRFFFAGTPTGAQTFDVGLVISPSGLPQGAVAPVTLYGNYVNESVSVSSEIDVLNQTLIAEGLLVWLRVSVFAPVGTYNISVGNQSVQFDVVEGPLDPNSVVYDVSSTENRTVRISVNISVADFVNPAQVSIGSGSLILFDDESDEMPLVLEGVVVSNDSFLLSFEPPCRNISLREPVLNLSLNFAESFSPSVEFDDGFILPAFNLQTYPFLCGIIVIPPGGCCPPVGGGPVVIPCLVPGTGCGSDLLCEPLGSGGVLSFETCPLGTTVCTVFNPPSFFLQPVCDSLHVGLPGVICTSVPFPAPPIYGGTACSPPYLPGICVPPINDCPIGSTMFSDFFTGYMWCSVCGDGIVQPGEECDPPGPSPICLSGTCGPTCLCALPPTPLPPGGGDGTASYISTQCYPLPDICERIDALNNGQTAPVDFRSWGVAMVAPNGNVMPSASDTKYPSFEACWQHNVGLNMFGSPGQYVDAFTIVGDDGVRRWTELPESYPAGDAVKFNEQQVVFKNNLGDRGAHFGISDESADLCKPSGVHIVAVSEAKCQVSNDEISVFWTRGWSHYWTQDIDRMEFLSTGYVISGENVDVSLLVSPGSRPDLSVEEIAGGVVDGRSDKCRIDDKDCAEVVKKKFKYVPDWSLALKSVATDTMQKKDVKEVVLTPADCVSCPLFVNVGGKEYSNPCCDPSSNVPLACCDSKSYFLQGKALAKSVGQCYSVSAVLDGPKKNVCLVGQNSCDINSPGFVLDMSGGLYNQFDWKPLGVECSVVFNPVEQSFSSSAFKEAVKVCPPVQDCKIGDVKKTGENVGICKERVEECIGGVWVVVEPGVDHRPEFCNGEDDDCNGKIDDILLCECPGSRATQPCFVDQLEPVQTCENRKGHYYWSLFDCVEPPKKSPVIRAAEVAQDEFVVQTVDGFGVPCGVNDFSCCIVFDKETDGSVVFEKTSSVIPPGYVPIGSYKIDNCDGGDVDIAMNIKPVESAVAVFKRAGKEQKLPVGLKTSLDCAGIDFQSLSDQSSIPEISLQEISEGAVLSSDSNVLSALDVNIEFSGDIDGVQANLKNADVKFKNKALAVVGAPMELSFDSRPGINVRISAPLVLKARVDVSSLGFYVLQDDEWKYLGGSVENDMFVVELDDVSQYQPLVFMIAGGKCANCEQAYLSFVRDVNSPVLVVLVHGFLSAPDLAWSAFLKQFRDEGVNVDVAVFGYQSMAPDDAVKVLGERLQSVEKDYSKVVFIAHSLGGLIVQKLLLEDSSLLPKVDAVITAGTPYSGTPLASTGKNVFDLFSVLLDNVDYAPILGVRPETLNLLESGVPEAFPSGIKVFSLVGTSDFLGMGSAFGLEEPNDAMVEEKSATRGGSFSEVCVDVLMHEENHFYLNRAADERYTLLYFLRQLSSEFGERAPSQMYAALRISDCQPGEIILYGKPINPRELPPPIGCEGTTCGDGVCQTTENLNICERDCSPPRKEYAVDVCGISSWAVNILLLLDILLLCAYVLTRRRLVVYVYALSALALSGFIANFLLCSSLPVIPMIVFGIILLILLVDYYVKFVPRYYRWH